MRAEEHQPNREGEGAGTPEGQSLEVRIEKLVYGGDGLGRVDGRVVMVPFVLPGETVRASIRRQKPGLVNAKLVSVLEPAPGRAPPSCPYFYRCGGCQYQHAEYAVQLEQKKAVLVEALRRIGKLDPPPPETISGPPWEYRNRTQFHFAGGRIGYFESGSHRLCDIERCPISSPKINETLRTLREMIKDRRFPRFVRSLEVFTNETGVQLNVLETEHPVAQRFFDWAAERIPGLAPGALEYRVGEASYRVGHRSFFQVNRFLAEALVERALEGAEGDTAFDLYAGVGLFAVPMARRFRQVVAVESGASAARDLEFNARLAGAAVEVRQNLVDLFLGERQDRPDFVLADPPRAGLGKLVVRELLRLRPPKVAIVACDPATLARDLVPLTAGGYRFERLTMVDLFPQTYHIEAVARLTL